MVQRPFLGKGHCKPNGVPSRTDSSNDDQNRTQHLSAAEGTPSAMTMSPFQALMDHCNIQACEIVYRLDSGKAFRVTKTQLEPQEVRTEDLLTRRLSRSSLDIFEDLDHEDLAPESGQSRGLPRAGRHCLTPKRKRRGSSSLTPAPHTKRRPTRSRRAAVSSNCNSDSEDEIDELEGAETETRLIRVDEVHLHFYDIAFRSISQLACKDIAKAWIRFCHPRKQTSHPYNGGKEGSERSMAEYDYLGHYTKPDYWPSDEGWKMAPDCTACRHREPDHVKKPERIVLLTHLIRSQNRGFRDGNFSLERMKKSTKGIHLVYKKNWTAAYVERLEEIYWVRSKEMEFERGEIDGDTLVPVQMPKTRCKGRKAPRPAVKAADPPSAQIKTEPEETSCTTYNAPVANMSIDVQVEEEDTTPSEGSEPGILVDTSSLTEEAAIDASCSEPILSESRTIQHGLPLLDSPTPLERQQNSAWWAQEKWTSLSAYLGQDPTAATYPNAFGLVMTPGEAQRDMPVPGQYRSESSSIQSFPSQAAHRQFDYESTASHGFANRMCPHGTFTRSPPDRPIAPKVENFCHPTFAASSTGLEGAWSADPDYQGLQTDSLWNAQIEPLVYTPAAHPSMPCTNNSFSSVGSGTSFSSGHTWNGGNQAPMPACHQGLDEDLHHLNLRAVSAPQYQHLGVNTPSVGNPDLVNPYLYTTDFRSHNPLDAENRLDSSSHHQRQL